MTGCGGSWGYILGGGWAPQVGTQGFLLDLAGTSRTGGGGARGVERLT